MSLGAPHLLCRLLEYSGIRITVSPMLDQTRRETAFAHPAYEAQLLV